MYEVVRLDFHEFLGFSLRLMSFLYVLSDLSHVFSSVRRDLNFIDHSSDLGWKE